ncbi:MAG: 4Fe-4S dicluster domain-containing protein [Dehalococcoidia bacterium]
MIAARNSAPERAPSVPLEWVATQPDLHAQHRRGGTTRSAASAPRPAGWRKGEPAAEDVGKHQWVMVFDLRRCDGCEECTKACNEMHYLNDDQPWIPVFRMKSSGGQEYFLPRPCMMCEDPPCTKVCPVTATYRVEDGVTVVDQDVCIGCRMCLASCPYQHRTFNWTQPKQPPADAAHEHSPEFNVPQRLGTAGKCDGCLHETREGRLPACATSCGMNAVFMGDLVTDTMTNGTETYRLSQYLRENDAFRLKEELNTKPRVFYVAGHGQDLEF